MLQTPIRRKKKRKNCTTHLARCVRSDPQGLRFKFDLCLSNFVTDGRMRSPAISSSATSSTFTYYFYLCILVSAADEFAPMNVCLSHSNYVKDFSRSPHFLTALISTWLRQTILKSNIFAANFRKKSQWEEGQLIVHPKQRQHGVLQLGDCAKWCPGSLYVFKQIPDLPFDGDDVYDYDAHRWVFISWTTRCRLRVTIWCVLQEAAKRIKGAAHITPVMTSDTVNEMAGNSLFFKVSFNSKTQRELLHILYKCLRWCASYKNLF